MPGESNGILHPVDAWDGRDKFAVLFGQAVSVTALQATQVFATIANGGVRVQPHIIKGWTSPDGTYTPVAAGGDDPGRLARDRQDRAHHDAERRRRRHGRQRRDPRLPGGRQDGDGAELGGREQGITVSFIGVAPADDPRIAVAVILHNPKTSIYGGTVAAPVFSDVAGYTLSELGVAPSGTTGTLFPTTW